MEAGKFPPELLQRLLLGAPAADPSVLLGPGLGLDAAVLDLGGRRLVVKSDPVTMAADRIGWYAVQVNANDVACTGAAPRWFLATLLAPERFSEDQAAALFDEVSAACRSLGVALVGGHSEVTVGLARPIVAGTMLGELPEGQRLIAARDAQEGDSIIVTKGIAIEGTAGLARDGAGPLAAAGVSPAMLDRAAALLDAPGISILAEARIAAGFARLHALHDVTEGGLITGLRELAAASGLGLAVEEDSIPILPETAEVCGALGLDPLGLLASGALLATLPAPDAPRLLLALEREGIDAWEIGQMLAPEEGLVLFSRSGEERPLPEFRRDELARYLSATTAAG